MNKEEIKNRINNLNIWKRGSQRAPHKPLLVLYAIGRYLQKKDRLISYADVDSDLKKLLIEFGPSRKSYHPEFPFWHLCSDGIWEIDNIERLDTRKPGGGPKKSELIHQHAFGGFTDDVFQVLSRDNKFVTEIVTDLLKAHFPDSIHEDILQAVGIDLITADSRTKARDPYFRERILRAYEYQCAVCGFNVRVGDSLVALEAAHIKWHQAGGPDNEQNGIALCSLHHKLFDRGAFTLSDTMKLRVSETAHGTNGFNEWLMAYHDKTIRPPQRPSYYPEPTFIAWHVNEVFKGNARYC